MLDRQSNHATISDQDLIARVAEGDRRAFELLVERHAAAVLRLATAVSDPTTAEDAMQQTFLNVYQHAASFRGDASARTWLLTIARNTAFRLHGKTRREEPVEEPLMQLGLDAGWGSEDPEAMAIAAERKGAVRKALSLLSADDREVLILRELEGLRGRRPRRCWESGSAPSRVAFTARAFGWRWLCAASCRRTILSQKEVSHDRENRGRAALFGGARAAQ